MITVDFVEAKMHSQILREDVKRIELNVHFPNQHGRGELEIKTARLTQEKK